ncbi:MAG: nitrite reductase small subunit NirD [Candidatus Omnitrophica bacterium]|nr:nitrite reductase small subunit NirD [Candidatus Omnitrophota bacterium]
MNGTKQIKWFRVAGVGAIPEKEGRQVQYGQHVVALFNLGEEYLAVENQCPHKGGPLADGIVAGKNVFCPLHNWKINLENGCALSGGTGRVKTFPVKVARNEIYLAFEEASYQECDLSGQDQNSQVSNPVEE